MIDGTIARKTKSVSELGARLDTVAEWCYDWYDTVSIGEETNPTGSLSGENKVFRGGNYLKNDDWIDFTVETRESKTPQTQLKTLGFRVVRSAKN